jgi:hypothetical protein
MKENRSRKSRDTVPLNGVQYVLPAPREWVIYHIIHMSQWPALWRGPNVATELLDKLSGKS